MYMIPCTEQPLLRRKLRPVLLAFLICAGTVFGIYTAILGRPVFTSLMRMAMRSRVSIVRRVFVVLLPFLLSVFTVLLYKPVLLYPVCAAKSFSFVVCVFTLWEAFFPAGWLACILLLFADAVSVVLLLCFSIRYVCGFSEASLKELTVCCVLSASAAVVDACMITPFLLELMNY